MTKDMKDIVALCKRRGFIFQASEIYGGINGFWDYGPLGTELKNNLRDAWWRDMVITPPIGPDGTPLEIVGLDSAIIQNPNVWVSSGHVGGFTDPMTDCTETKKRYRADHIIIYSVANLEVASSKTLFAFEEGTELDEIKKKIKKFYKKQNIDFKKEVIAHTTGALINYYDPENLGAPVPLNLGDVVAPDTYTKGTLLEPKAFNLMFETYIGATQSDDNKAYLRGETAQGIFINYKNVLDSTRVRVPFGIAQIGKAFRNEVNPRNFIFRSREFEQMEMEWFCDPEDAPQWFEFWKEERQKWWKSVGLKDKDMIFREHGQDELVFYSQGTFDIEYQFPFTAPGYGELEGVAYRTNYDLTQHQEGSKTKMEYIDPMDPKNRYIPHVIEPAAGLTRGVLALLCDAYTVDENRPSGVFLDFTPAMAPKKAAILPLTAKGEHPEIATKLYLELRKHYAIDLDIKQNIGKRYARQDEIGTPYCFTIDDDTVADGTVTVRERNTMAQERIHIDKVLDYLREKIDG